MTRLLPLLALPTVLLLAFLAWGTTDSAAPPATLPWAVEVYREYCPELTDEAHIEDCWTGYAEEELHLVVVTDMPTLVSSEIDTIPILTAAPPSSPPAPLAALPRAVAVYRASCPALLAEVYVEDCWTGYVGEDLHLVVVTDSPDLIPAEVDTIPTITMAPPTEDGPDNSESDSQGTGSTTSGASGQGGMKTSGSGTQQSTKSTETSGTQTPPSSSIIYFSSVDMYGYSHDDGTPWN